MPCSSSELLATLERQLRGRPKLTLSRMMRTATDLTYKHPNVDAKTLTESVQTRCAIDRNGNIVFDGL